MSRLIPLPDETLASETSGSQAPLWWGMLTFILIDMIIYASFISSYFYLRVTKAQVWPPAGIMLPDLVLPAIAGAILLASAAPVFWAERAIVRGDTRPLKFGLPVACLLAAAYLVLQAVAWSEWDFRWSTNAYGSLIWTISGFQAMHVLFAMVYAAVISVLGWQGYFTARRHLGVQVAALFWYFVAVIYLAVYATLYLAPRWI